MENKGKVVLFYPSFKGIGVYHWVPFPYIYLGPFLENRGFQIVVIDARVEPDWEARLKAELATALCLGITSMTGPDINQAILAAQTCRLLAPGIKVVWGGPQATVQPDLVIAQDWVDIVVRGQGEEIFPEILERLVAGKSWEDIDGLSYKANGKVVHNREARGVEFHRNALPAYHLVDIEKYRSSNNIMSVFASRGCPFQCTFCTTGRKTYSEKSVEQVREELAHVVRKLGFKNIFFQDGTFFVRRKRVMEIARMILEEGFDIKWKAKARANSLFEYADEDFELLKRSGLVSIFFGVESGSPRVLKNMLKGISPEDAVKSAAICGKFGFEFYASYMFATPQETVEDLQATLANIHQVKAANPQALIQNCIYLPLPGTPMYDQACGLGFRPPRTLEQWGQRNISSLFDQRTDVSWMPRDVLEGYARLYNAEFTNYKHAWEREKEGLYKSPLNK